MSCRSFKMLGAGKKKRVDRLRHVRNSLTNAEVRKLRDAKYSIWLRDLRYNGAIEHSHKVKPKSIFLRGLRHLTVLPAGVLSVPARYSAYMPR